MVGSLADAKNKSRCGKKKMGMGLIETKWLPLLTSLTNKGLLASLAMCKRVRVCASVGVQVCVHACVQVCMGVGVGVSGVCPYLLWRQSLFGS